MDTKTQKAVGEVVRLLIAGQNKNLRQTVKFISPSFVVRATRPVFGGPITKKRILKGSSYQFLLHIGKPNYKERLFIQSCKKAGLKFPVKDVQLKYIP